MTNANYTPDDILNKDILELLGLQNVPEEKKKELYTKMLATIQNRVVARIADKLTKTDLEEWKKLTVGKDQQKMGDFLQAKGIDPIQMMTQEALIYKTELVNLSQTAKGE